MPATPTREIAELASKADLLAAQAKLFAANAAWDAADRAVKFLAAAAGRHSIARDGI